MLVRRGRTCMEGTMPSPYEDNAVREIEAWKHPDLGWFGKAMQVINVPLDKAGDAVLKTPGVGWAIQKSIGGLVNVTNDAAQWSVRPDVIYEEYRKSGHAHVHSAGHLATLDLEHVDRAVGWLAAKYKGAALTEGAAFGAMGLLGIPPDIVALVGLNLRAIGEYATYCGFDSSSQGERLYAMHVLGLASSPNDGAKGLAMAELVKIAKDVATKKAWKDSGEARLREADAADHQGARLPADQGEAGPVHPVRRGDGRRRLQRLLHEQGLRLGLLPLQGEVPRGEVRPRVRARGLPSTGWSGPVLRS